MSNLLFVLLDGAEDDPCPQLGGKKPIEVAEMPFLESKVTHRYRTTGRGYTQLFLNEFFTGHPPEIGRAALEAYGLGLPIDDPKRVAYRLSPAKLGDGMVHWCYHNEDFADELQERIMSHIDLLEPYNPAIRFFVEGRSVLTMESDTVPETPAPPVDAPEIKIDGALGQLIDAVASEMDGITVYPWGCGRAGKQYPAWPGLRDLTSISDSPTSLGVCSSLGFNKVELVYDLEERFPIAREALKHGDVFLHIDEVDEYSHQKDPFKKKAVLERTDELMAEYFADADRIIYFADHGTSCVTGEHIVRDTPVWTTFDLGAEEGSTITLDRLVPSIIEHR